MNYVENFMYDSTYLRKIVLLYISQKALTTGLLNSGVLARFFLAHSFIKRFKKKQQNLFVYYYGT